MIFTFSNLLILVDIFQVNAFINNLLETIVLI